MKQGHGFHRLWWKSAYPGLCDTLSRRLCAYSMADATYILGFINWINAYQLVLCSVSLPFNRPYHTTESSHLDKLNNLCLYWTGGSVIMYVFISTNYATVQLIEQCT